MITRKVRKLTLREWSMLQMRLVSLVILAVALTACDLGPAPEQPTPVIEPTPVTPGATEVPLSPVVVDTPTEQVPGITPRVMRPTDTAVPSGVDPTIEAAGVTPTPAIASETECRPTREDGEGPFYVPNAPERSSVGTGHVLRGQVKSSRGCQLISGAKLEFWMANPQGEYDDAHRATLYTGDMGMYQFESNFPPGYGGRPPHIHIKVSAEGHRTLTTQYYPEQGDIEGTFDLVLVPNTP